MEYWGRKLKYTDDNIQTLVNKMKKLKESEDHKFQSVYSKNYKNQDVNKGLDCINIITSINQLK